ncbi:DUF6798 domain-containing protein [Lacipirellula sp.]|uniref:DUF6798 domain-containing protein n=1 Tax=Lacipirellula sp. TaxID=2691419 RepID=UPI003D0DBCA2
MTASEHNAPVNSRRQWFEFTLVLLIFFIDGGAAVPHVNETHYLTKAKHYWDASYCPGDLFLDSADPHLAFYWTLGWLTKFLPLTAVAWIGRIAAWALLAAGWQRLSTSIVNVPWASVLGAALWVALLRDGNRNFAGEWVVGGVEAKCYAYGLFLFGMAALVRGDWRRPWIWFGAASVFHVLVGAWAVLTALATWIIEPRAERTPLLKLLPGLVVGGLLSLIGLLPSLALERGTDPALNAEAAQIYVYDRLPHHLAPLSLPAAEVQWRLTWLGGMVVAFVSLWVWWRRHASDAAFQAISGIDSPAAARRLIRFTMLALAFAVAGLVIELSLDHDRLAAARLLRYYWFRQIDVALPLAIAILGSAWVAAMLRNGKRFSQIVAPAPLLFAVWFLGSITYARWQSNLPPAVLQVENAAAWQAACQWIDEHTPADAKFLIPRWGHSFKWYASRADVGSNKDVPQDAAGVVEWRARMRELYPNLDSVDERDRKIMLDSPELLGTPRVRELAEKYDATHVIARSYPPLDLPIVFATPVDPSANVSGYTVYETGVEPKTAAP